MHYFESKVERRRLLQDSFSFHHMPLFMMHMHAWNADDFVEEWQHVPWNISSSCGSTKYRLDAEAKGSMVFRILKTYI